MAKTKTTSTEQSHQTNSSSATTSTNVPSWIADPAKQYVGGVGGLQTQGPGAFAPQTGALENQAFAGAGGLTNSGYFEQGGNALHNVRDIGAGTVSADQVAGQSLLDGGLDRYYNPFKEQITNPVLSDYDEQSGLTRAGQAADAARNKAFQGSRYGIQEAQTEGQLARGRAATEGDLLKGMYEHSTSLAGADADRRQGAMVANQGANLSASQANQQAALAAAQANQQTGLDRGRALGDLGAAETASNRSNLALQGDLGAQQSDALNRERQYPIEFQGQIGSLLDKVDPNDYASKTVDMSGVQDMTGSGTGTQKTSPGLLDMVGMGAQIGSMFLSDRRAKRDIRTVGYDGHGRRWVTFAYAWAPMARFFGVIAQEVMRTDPGAVALGPDGYLRVNYGAL